MHIKVRYPRGSVLKFIILILIFTSLSCATTQSSLYSEALRDIKSGSIDFAFMKLNNYLQEYPNSTRTPKIKFGIIEYYFQTKNYRNAIRELTKYIIDYPDEKSSVFAQAILYKILLEYKKDSPLIEKLKEAFFSKPIFLVFSDSKTKSYKSIFNNNYKIVDYVNEIEVYKNNELLIEITP